MHSSEIKSVVDRVPFRPFVIRLSNGMEYPVTHSYMLGGNPSAVHWFEQVEPYRVVRIDPALITEIVEQ
jgi:hypothetical protein